MLEVVFVLIFLALCVFLYQKRKERRESLTGGGRGVPRDPPGPTPVP